MNGTTNAQVSEGLTLAEGAALQSRFSALAGRREAVVRDTVGALVELSRAGVVETLEGLPLDVWLTVEHGWTAAERRMLLDAGDVVASMPALAAWWDRGIVSWSTVREVVGRVRSLGRDGRATVDARLAASTALAGELDPDQLLWAVEAAVDEVRGADAKEREEAAAERDAFLALQLDFAGGSWVSGYLDPLATAITTGGLDRRAAADTNRAGSLGSTAKDRARALVGICGDELGATPADPNPADPNDAPDPSDASDPNDGPIPSGPGNDGADADSQDEGGPSARRGPDEGAPDDGPDQDGPEDDGPDWGGPDECAPFAREPDGPGGPGGRRRRRSGRPARPLFVVHVPLDRLTETASGLLEVAVPGLLPRLSAGLVDNLARDADIRAVVFDGARPLHVTAKTHAEDLPDDTRLAVLARDLGARDPTGRTPAPSSHVHHLEPGNHDPDRVVTISERGHIRIVHKHGWSGEVDPDTGVVTWTRGTRTIRTLPWGTPLNPADPTNQPDQPDRTDGPEPERPTG